MVKSFSTKAGIVLCLFVLAGSMVQARTADGARPAPGLPSPSAPAYCNTYHNVGRIALGVSNDGTFGSQLSVSGAVTDCFTGDILPSCEFPKLSRTSYLFGAALWVGAVLGRDTLVSTGADGWTPAGNEFHPDEPPFGNMIYRSTIDPARPEFEGAISEQDYSAVYYDTCRNCIGVSNDIVDGRAHLPLELEVSQDTYAWSYSYAQDFVLFDYAVKNIGDDRLRRVYMGIYVDADIHDLADQRADGGAQDDFCGFREWQPALYLKPPCPSDSDQVNIAWTVDNQGDMDQVTLAHVPHVTATRIVRTPSDSLEVSFNWWVSNGINPALDYGPQTRANPRDFGTGGFGTPQGDRNKFFILRNGEFDFDQVEVGTISSLDSVWIPPPPENVGPWSQGLDTRYVLSFGPFDIEPGQTLPVSLAYVAGVDFHRDPDNLNNLPNNPESWYEGVNFDSLGSNATWAEWVYDNPGVDTDSDGYAGTFTVCNLGGDSTRVCDTFWDSSVFPPVITDSFCYYDYDLADTVWRKGDGVPDFRGATPPPSPASYTVVNAGGELVRGLRVEPEVGKIRVRWNGVLAENTPDVFSRELDFEGYRVYIARDERASSFSVIGSYDIEDFNRWEYDEGEQTWTLEESPFTLEELRCRYADSCNDPNWHPDTFTRFRPLIINPDSIYYFEPQDFNQSILANDPVNSNSPLMKTYPNAPIPPVLEPDSIRILFPDGADTLYLTEEGFIKAFEYEMTIDNLLPTVPYWVNVTAFDYGSPQSGLTALETSPTLLPLTTYPLESIDRVAELDLEVFVYPNPYRFDGDYRDRGFEARGRADRMDDKARRVHFANLPAKCTISIYSLDGDLVREIEHDVDPSDPLANHESWDLITRNSQLVVSGLYYWSVEDEDGDIQIGKLAIVL